MKKLFIFGWLMLWLPLAVAGEVFGTVDALNGSATVAGQDGQSAALSVGMKVYEGDTINTAHDGEVQIVTEDGGFIALRPDTVFRIDAYKADGGDDDKTFMSLLKGAARSITGWIGRHNNAAYRITTPTATVGIRGTDHEVTVVDQGGGDQPGTYDTVNEGSTVLKTQQGEVVATPGKYAYAPRGRAVRPYFLTRRPRFFALRRLRLEARVLQRRQYLRPRLQQMREDRIRNRRELRGQRPGAARMGQGRQMNRGREMNRRGGMNQGREMNQRRGLQQRGEMTPRQRRMERRNELRRERQERRQGGFGGNARGRNAAPGERGGMGPGGRGAGGRDMRRPQRERGDGAAEGGRRFQGSMGRRRQ